MVVLEFLILLIWNINTAIKAQNWAGMGGGLFLGRTDYPHYLVDHFSLVQEAF